MLLKYICTLLATLHSSYSCTWLCSIPHIPNAQQPHACIHKYLIGETLSFYACHLLNHNSRCKIQHFPTLIIPLSLSSLLKTNLCNNFFVVFPGRKISFKNQQKILGVLNKRRSNIGNVLKCMLIVVFTVQILNKFIYQPSSVEKIQVVSIFTSVSPNTKETVVFSLPWLLLSSYVQKQFLPEVPAAFFSN